MEKTKQVLAPSLRNCSTSRSDPAGQSHVEYSSEWAFRNLLTVHRSDSEPVRYLHSSIRVQRASVYRFSPVAIQWSANRLVQPLNAARPCWTGTLPMTAITSPISLAARAGRALAASVLAALTLTLAACGGGGSDFKVMKKSFEINSLAKTICIYLFHDSTWSRTSMGAP